MTEDDWRYLRTVLNNLEWLAGQVVKDKTDGNYVWQHDFKPFIKWLIEHDK